MSTGLKANSDGSAAIQVGGTDFLTVTSGGNTTFTQPANLPNTFGFKNRIINGAMVIDQRNAGASVTPSAGNNTYTLDRWNATYSLGSKFSVQQNAGSVTPPVGFTNYLGATSLSAYSVPAGETYNIVQSIEGFNTADLAWGTANAQTVTLSFWVRSSLTGTFGGALRNSASNRSYPFSYTISSANTWEQKSVTIAGDTTGTWVGATNGIGINVQFALGAGSTYSGTAGSWAGANYYSATGATSVVGTNGATFYITGVQLEKGSTATSFDYRPYGTELALCQRYYYRINAESSATPFFPCNVSSATLAFAIANFPVSMRVTPTAMDQSGTASDYAIGHAATVSTLSAVPAFAGGTTNGGRINCTVASGLTTGQAGFFRSATSNAYLGFSAEL